ncbi:MAG: 2-octaprenyl-3-methyl-6-methoxy-1,4-benzoquinol hydroxylase [Candidatus Muproteobacteria bacterium RIFCSPHIGHO2_02_FULL_60_13]|uniref:3-demethoxyubiquinol 3-hydroxylase n=1 Tax=Candidatus Muproteobacteria bacterium RIFCSPLOWO2_01_FULL_60_18 TaxID=1817768 RepID=A0A1F6TZ48_9PROT|nr:MAG: 2-octaprenyl-3-methyl-6-methoxy-1,4-benzoquinol hydroxylase [Candidatus Muproteobacteria bacterium RIFCSPHIGHO2_01_60_12]OGI50377.1 MAG: 2-octaprenyl-3-methyl-6-methoxy-1,4-benzoquinol hydroxylase [Candidatus Muproteobacteria bacterium RIFCSPLOWO2_01_FULL_60_18]OGI54189.1 MAG: 2-octaprenyl-3-methyl-6-methoxy-1,4-benzoquinol hydroxylase [Candidatus Muproteobacteria bacterium RIFCSPHIGHO2_02_FULL_60_13]
MINRNYSFFDQLIGQLDNALHTVFGPVPNPGRASPATDKPDTGLSASERELSGRLMRINHAGEICAQALYQGQAATARLPEVRGKMEQAAQEENDHLAWTEERIREFGGHTSYLNPLWYAGSFAIGALAGVIGDKWSLGFVAETEKQVVQHLDGHLQRLPTEDRKSRAILEQMRDDEGRHATVAIESGGAELPEPVRQLMRLTSKVMTETAYWI